MTKNYNRTWNIVLIRGCVRLLVGSWTSGLLRKTRDNVQQDSEPNPEFDRP